MSNIFVLGVLLTWAYCIRSTWNAQNWFIDGAIRRTHTFEWFSDFKLGKLVEDCECSGHSSTGCTDENTHKVHKRVSEDYQSTILKIAGRSGLYGTCQ